MPSAESDSPREGEPAPSPDRGDGPMTSDQLAEAKRYNRARLAWGLVDLAITFSFFAVAALLLAKPVDEWLAGFAVLANRWLRLAALFGLLIAASAVLALPLDCYTGHVLEHRYGLSRQSFGKWLWRWTKQSLLSALLGVLLIEGFYGLISVTGAWWWLAAAAAFFLVTVVLGQLAPVLILPLFYKVERLEDQELAGRFSALAAGSDLNVEGVYRMAMSEETVKANAMLAGLGRTRRVILGDTLLDNFSPQELEVIFAHELGHHVFRHLPKLLAFGLAYSAIGFYLCHLALRWWIPDLDYAALPVWAMPFLLFVLGVFSLLIGPIGNALSRRFERQCDRYALERTHDAPSYRAAFQKLAKQNKADPDPPRWEVILFHDHPPIAERLQMAE
jgi:STE24 endopeptidase